MAHDYLAAWPPGMAKSGRKRFSLNGACWTSLLARGYLAVAISQPGYGGSTGPADFCGPFTQHAVAAVIAKLHADGYVKDNRVLIQGVSRGALVAGMVAAHDPSIRGIVLISGLYDLPAYASHAKSAMAVSIVDSMKAETGGTAEALEVAITALLRSGHQSGNPDSERRQGRPDRSRSGAARWQRLSMLMADTRGQLSIRSMVTRFRLRLRSKDVDPFIERVLGRYMGTP